MKKLIFIIVFLTTLIFVSAQSYNLNDTIPIDATIIKGKLDNGLTYYVKENKMPENRVIMRLVVNAGSIQEDDDQRGLAHFFEHMCFNGTKNFEKQELVDFLEKTGVKFGPDLNAYTSFDETVYYFQIPTERESLVDTGLMVLSDWAQHVTLDPEEIDKERGVVIEEWRLHLGADDRMMKEWLPEALKGSRYADRLPIGDTNIIKNCSYETVERFYKDWYRPDLMAVVVVGDIDKENIAEKIKEKFSSIPAAQKPRERKIYDVPSNKEPLISIVTDEEAPYITIEFFYKHDKFPEGTIGVYKEFIKRQLFNGMMAERLSEILQTPEAPFLYGTTRYSSFIGRTKDAYMSAAISKENMTKESLERLIIENQRVKKFGFTEGEFERQKKDVLKNYEKALKELGKTDHNSYADEYSRNYLTNEPIPGIEKEFDYVKHFLPQITIEDINNLAKKWIIDKNMVVIITGPDKEGLEYPNEKEIIDIIKKAENTDVKGYVDEVDDTPLLPKLPQKGSIVKEDYNEELDFYDFKLTNGARVIAKSTDYKNDEILFRAHSYGGESMYGVEDLFSVQFADVITRISGVANTDNVSLTKKMAGSTANINFSIGSYNESVSGSSSPDDLKDLLTLNYLYFTQPRKDQKAFDAYISRIENQIKFLESDPASLFNDTITKVIYSNSPRHISILKQEHIDQIRLDKTYEIFKERFSDPSDFTFYFVGNINIDSLKEGLVQYLASIPSTNNKEKWNDIDTDFPEGISEINLYKGIDPKAQVYMFMNGEMKWKKSERTELSFLIKALSIRLRKKIREDEGGTYGVRASVSMTDIPKPEYTITIGFGCNPKKTDTLFNIVIQELNNMINEGPSAEEMEKIKEIYNRERETNLKDNGFWISSLQNLILKDEDILMLNEFKKEINDIEIKDVQKVAKKYIKMDNYVHAVLRPEEMKP